MQRSDIIQAAAVIFREKGYHATSMQDIAAAVNLQKASLYHHVTSKQDILFTILEQTLDLLIADIQDVLTSSAPPQEKLRMAMKGYMERLLSEDADLAAVLLLEHRSLEQELREKHIARRDRYEALWRQIVQEGVDQGVFHPVDVPITTFAILGVQNWMITWFRQNGRLKVDDVAEYFYQFFLQALTPVEDLQRG